MRTLAERINEMAARLGVLVDAQRAFVADASHELRTPLTALRLQLENLQQSPSTESRGARRRDRRGHAPRSPRRRAARSRAGGRQPSPNGSPSTSRRRRAIVSRSGPRWPRSNPCSCRSTRPAPLPAERSRRGRAGARQPARERARRGAARHGRRSPCQPQRRDGRAPRGRPRAGDDRRRRANAHSTGSGAVPAPVRAVPDSASRSWRNSRRRPAATPRCSRPPTASVPRRGFASPRRTRPRSSVRGGALDDRLDDVRAHLRATVREKLLVANPAYLVS